VKNKVTNRGVIVKGKLCNYCHYRRQAKDIGPEWECPQCQRVYHKVPLNHEQIPKNKYVGSFDVEPSALSRIPLEFSLSLCIALFDLTYGWLTNWQRLTPQINPTEHVIVILCCLAVIWFGGPFTALCYKHLPIRTGIMEHLAKKNKHEEALIIKHMPRLVVLLAWAFFLWFIFKVSWLYS